MQTANKVTLPANISSWLKADSFKDPKWGQIALWAGIAFSFLFTAIIWATGDRLAAFVKPPDQGPLDYYWKLADPTWLTRLVAWGSYLAQQFFNWGLIYYAQKRVKKYTPGLHPMNVVALIGNALFIVWHLVQTHLFYDGLAQDVSILTSQGSVIIMLVWILLMENKRRGLLFGKKAPLSKTVVDWARKYHGYVFSWAIVYTFWYHPAEHTQGHLIGFLYMFLLMVQGSLFMTRIHVNRWWTLAQEVMVLFHGVLVAMQQGNNLWPMFLFGFAAIFLITQMWGLGLSRRWLIAFTVVFGALATLVYWGRPLAFFSEVIRIPMIEYLSVLVLALLIGGPLWVWRKLRSRQSAPASEAA